MKNIFPKNILTNCLNGDILTGLTQEALCLFVKEINKQLRAPIILSLETYERSYIIYESLLLLHDISVFFYPEKDRAEMIPGFISHRERYRQDVLFNLIEKKNPVTGRIARSLQRAGICILLGGFTGFLPYKEYTMRNRLISNYEGDLSSFQILALKKNNLNCILSKDRVTSSYNRR